MTCLYCAESTPPKQQFYETKLFRVVVARRAITEGHVMIVHKSHDPHFYSFTPDDIEELGYVMKKVSFWVMRFTRTPGFTVVAHDGTAEVIESRHFQIHIIPRQLGGQQFTELNQAVGQVTKDLDDATIDKTIKELQNLMQLPHTRG